jgi:DNA repair exonuclease SbcCD ATPase subunit
MTATLEDLVRRASIRRRELDHALGEVRSIRTQAVAVKSEIGTLSEEVSNLDRVSLLLNSMGEDRQLQAQRVIEELVTRGLRTIFDETLSFHIIQTTKAKTANVEFFVRTMLADGMVVDTPVMEARGGGVAATIGFLLRLVVLLLRARDTREENLLVLDETFAHVSVEYLQRVGEFLREIVDKTGVQIVMVTHQQEFVDFGDIVYRFTQEDGKTVVTRQ